MFVDTPSELIAIARTTSRKGGRLPTYTNVKRYKRGAYWDDGAPRYCIGCRIAGKKRRVQAEVVAISRPEGKPRSGRALPVSYCWMHWKEILKIKKEKKT